MRRRKILRRQMMTQPLQGQLEVGCSPSELVKAWHCVALVNAMPSCISMVLQAEAGAEVRAEAGLVAGQAEVTPHCCI